MPRSRHSTVPPKEARLFRNNRTQVVCIPVEFELPGDKVLISREGDRLIIQPVRKTGLTALLTQWAKEPLLGPEDDSEIDDTAVKSENAKSYRHYLDILDKPPSGEGFARLMNAPKPWQS